MLLHLDGAHEINVYKEPSDYYASHNAKATTAVIVSTLQFLTHGSWEGDYLQRSPDLGTQYGEREML